MFVVTLSDLKPLETIDALMTRHVAWLCRHSRSGLFIASGRQRPRSGRIILARSGDRDALEALMAGDPFGSSGAATFAIVEFTASMPAPGAEVLKQLRVPWPASAALPAAAPIRDCGRSRSSSSR